MADINSLKKFWNKKKYLLQGTLDLKERGCV